MIFVTVGTHEQGMDRLFIELDRLVEEGIITEKVYAQVGYTKYKPRNFEYKEMIGYDEMDSFMKKSNVIITHGGPGSIFHAIRYGKTPIVVPRNPKFNEHVDEHQILFTKRLEYNFKVIGVYNINELKNVINNYEKLKITYYNEEHITNNFIEKFEEIINNL